MVKKIFAYVILGLVIGVAIGFVIGKKHAGASLPMMGSTSTQNNAMKDDSVFSSETAFLTGKVTSVSGDSLSVTTENNKSATFKIQNPIMVMKNQELSKNTPASPSANIKDIPLNQLVSVNLRKVNGAYIVVSVVGLPTASSVPVSTTQVKPDQIATPVPSAK